MFNFQFHNFRLYSCYKSLDENNDKVEKSESRQIFMPNKNNNNDNNAMNKKRNSFPPIKNSRF